MATSDPAHEGLKAAIGAVFTGAVWQRCRVHFLRNVLAKVPKGNAKVVAAAIRRMFAQPGRGVQEALGACEQLSSAPVF